MKNFAIVVAMDEARGIGKGGGIPWHVPEDMRNFKEVTTAVSRTSKTNAVIMGRKTWDSLPEKFRPLPGRLNIVLSRQKDLALPKGVLHFPGLEEALAYIGKDPKVENVFVIGGAQVYEKAVNHPACNRLLATFVQGKFSCDTFFPAIPARFKPDSEEISVVGLKPVKENAFQKPSVIFITYTAL